MATRLIAISAMLGSAVSVQLSRGTVIPRISRGPDDHPEFMNVTGFVCGMGRDELAIYYPHSDAANNKTFPLISFSAGAHTELPKAGTQGTYVKLLTKLAHQGYVVIVPLSAENGWCSKQNEDQLTAIKAMEGHPLVDWTKGVGLLGHSMGGGATVMSAADEDAVKKYNITAAVALHAVIPTWNKPHKLRPQVPIMYGSGMADDMEFKEVGMDVVWKANRQLYQQTNVTGKLYALITDAPHYEPYTTNPWDAHTNGRLRGRNRWNDLVARFFDCHIKDHSKGSTCDYIYHNRTSIFGAPMSDYLFVEP